MCDLAWRWSGNGDTELLYLQPLLARMWNDQRSLPISLFVRNLISFWGVIRRRQRCGEQDLKGQIMVKEMRNYDEFKGVIFVPMQLVPLLCEITNSRYASTLLRSENEEFINKEVLLKFKFDPSFADFKVDKFDFVVDCFGKNSAQMCGFVSSLRIPKCPFFYIGSSVFNISMDFESWLREGECFFQREE